MVRPRRTPWSNEREIAELYSWIWEDVTDRAAQERALARLSLYQSSSSNPTALTLLHSLLSSALLPYPPPNPQTHLLSRQSCALSLIRFTNGLIDPLQLGAYARPMSLLARQIGLPAGLIGLRHEATHEELPSLEVLREGVFKALDYLRVESIEPLLNASALDGPLSGESSRMAERRASLEKRFDSLFRRYKKAMKAYMKERTSKAAVGAQAQGMGREVKVVLKDVQEVVDKAVMDFATHEEGGEVVVAESLAGCLFKVGSLIPVARKKRPSPNLEDITDIPTIDLQTLRLWTPLIQLLSQRLSAAPEPSSNEEEEDTNVLPETLARQALHLLQESEVQPDVELAIVPKANGQEEGDPADFDADFMAIDDLPEDEDPDDDEPTSGHKSLKKDENTSYRFSLLTWLYNIWRFSLPNIADGSGKRKRMVSVEWEALDFGLGGRCREEVERRVVEGLEGRLTALGVEGVENNIDGDYASLLNLFQAMRKIDTGFAARTDLLLTRLSSSRGASRAGSEPAGEEDELAVMEKRLKMLQEAMENARTPATKTTSKPALDTVASSDESAAPGWKLVDAGGWKAVPIGVWRE